MRKNIKKLVLVLLLCIVPKYTLFAEEATHKLDVNAFGGSVIGMNLNNQWVGAVGGSIGLQSQWSNPWIAMINSFAFTNIFDTKYQGKPSEKPNNPKYIKYFTYDIGMRVFLGTPYVFLMLLLEFYNIYPKGFLHTLNLWEL